MTFGKISKMREYIATRAESRYIMKMNVRTERETVTTCWDKKYARYNSRDTFVGVHISLYGWTPENEMKQLLKCVHAWNHKTNFFLHDFNDFSHEL